MRPLPDHAEVVVMRAIAIGLNGDLPGGMLELQPVMQRPEDAFAVICGLANIVAASPKELSPGTGRLVADLDGVGAGEDEEIAGLIGATVTAIGNDDFDGAFLVFASITDVHIAGRYLGAMFQAAVGASRLLTSLATSQGDPDGDASPAPPSGSSNAPTNTHDEGR